MTLTPAETVAAIVDTNRRIADFWGRAHGWAPIDAAQLLSAARLDWQVELSRMLGTWLQPPDAETANAGLILAWANLGALVEGTMKWFLSVYYNDYERDVEALRDRLGDIRAPDSLSLEPLREFYKRSIWDRDSNHWDAWVLHIQQRRNAIHAFRDRDLGDHDEFVGDVSTYWDFLREHDASVPYPD
ncbi:MAG TPA: hypothetical protein VMF30_19955 [Pirellulales bacterium]|nr:hypothetical protein [Pirellulales bacterium]